MKITFNISSRSKKILLFIIMISFISGSISNAVPLEKCTGPCTHDTGDLKCEIQGSDSSEHSCCSMMGMKQRSAKHQSEPCEKEFDGTKCSMETVNIDWTAFLIPKIIDTNISVEIILIIDQGDYYFTQIDNYPIEKTFLTEISPPIYLTNSSFLI